MIIKAERSCTPNSGELERASFVILLFHVSAFDLAALLRDRVVQYAQIERGHFIDQ